MEYFGFFYNFRDIQNLKPMNTKIKMLVANHHTLYRQCLTALLKTKPEIEVVGQAQSGRVLLDLLKNTPTDIVLLAYELTTIDAGATLEIMQVRFPNTKIAVLNDNYKMEPDMLLLSKGIHCYLTAKTDVAELFKALETVYYEDYYFDGTTSKAILDALKNDRFNDPERVSFSYREIQVIKAICNGQTNRQAAQSLHLSPSTIDFHKSKIYHKTKCNNATGLLKYAVKKGIWVI